MPLFNPPVAPLIVASDTVLAVVASAVLVGNSVYLFAFELQATTIFSGAKWRMAATTTGTTDIGVYAFAGSLLADTGAVTNVASSNMVANFSSGNLSLPAGQYFMALCCSNSTDTYQAMSSLNNIAVASRMRIATNTGTAGVLPATTGGYSDAPAKFPLFAITNANGLT